MENMPTWLILIIGGAGAWLLRELGKLIVKQVKKKYKIKDVDEDAITTIKSNCIAQTASIRAEIKKNREINTIMCDEVFPVLLNSVYAILVTMQNGKVNGEIAAVLEDFSDSFKKKFFINVAQKNEDRKG